MPYIPPGNPGSVGNSPPAGGRGGNIRDERGRRRRSRGQTAKRAGRAVQADPRQRLPENQRRGAAGLKGRQAANRAWEEAQRRARRQAQRSPASTGGGASVNDFMVPGIQGGVDPAIAAAAVQAGIDPNLLKQIGNPNVGNLIPLKLANRGARTLGDAELEELVSSLVSGGYEKQMDLMSQERERMEGQNAHNLTQLRGWYDQVLKSQGVAAGRSREFGQQAVESMTGATERIVSALGGEANEGSYVAGAAGQENIGNLGAIATIQDQFNADMAPLLQGEAAGSLAREQSAGADRLRDLSMRLSEMQTQRSADEANLRFQVWQQNNEVLNQRLQTELGIRQANLGIGQQRYQNRMGLAQMGIAAQQAGAEAYGDAQSLAVRVAQSNQSNAQKNADRAARLALEQAKEAGRNYRAGLSRTGGSNPPSYATASNNTKLAAYEDMLSALGEDDMSLQSAMKVVAQVASGYGWSPTNPGVRARMIRALRDAGYDV